MGCWMCTGNWGQGLSPRRMGLNCPKGQGGRRAAGISEEGDQHCHRGKEYCKRVETAIKALHPAGCWPANWMRIMRPFLLIDSLPWKYGELKKIVFSPDGVKMAVLSHGCRTIRAARRCWRSLTGAVDRVRSRSTSPGRPGIHRGLGIGGGGYMHFGDLLDSFSNTFICNYLKKIPSRSPKRIY